MNYFQNYGYANPYLNPAMQQPMNQQMQRLDNNYQQNFAQPTQFTPQKQIMSLQGKSVDSVEVVKAMDIPLDGSISYFPIADGSAIVTKQLQMDGTSKTIVYKPIDLENDVKPIKYITQDELDETLKNFDTTNLKDEIKTIKKQIKDMSKSLKNKEYDEED